MLSLFEFLSILGINGPIIAFRRRQALRLSPEHQKIVVDYLRDYFLNLDRSYDLEFLFKASTIDRYISFELEDLLDSLTTLEVSQKLKNKVDNDD